MLHLTTLLVKSDSKTMYFGFTCTWRGEREKRNLVKEAALHCIAGDSGGEAGRQTDVEVAEGDREMKKDHGRPRDWETEVPRKT